DDVEGKECVQVTLSGYLERKGDTSLQ
ncbi:hypothetical protein A2U01_0112691, partial [Trifolium medium]|nr:hypothetical protein [Trifolium medium]